MIVTVAGSAVTFLPNDAEIGGISIQVAAFDGAVGTGQFPIPDPSSALTPVTGRQFKVAQDFALISDGFIIDFDTHRGPFRVGNQVEYPISVMDANALLDGFRVTRSRSAETDYARVIAFAAADIPTADTTWVLNSSTVTMPAKKYDGVGWAELITDVVEFTGKTLFVHDKATGGRCLHYHVLTAGHTCGLSISDVVAAQNGVTVFAPIDPVRQRTSVDLKNDVKGRSPSGKTYTAVDATSETAHDADGLKHEALIDFDSTTTADLTAKTNAFLASQKNDSDTWTCSIGPLDGTALGLMRVGDIMTVTSAPMGLSASPQRISHITYTVEPGAESRGYWYATLELGAPIRRRARVKAAPSLATLVRPYVNVPFAPDMETEAAHAIIYSPHGNNNFGFPPLIVFDSTGDAPAGGLPYDPKTGGLAYEALTNGFGTRQAGIRVTKRGKLRLHAKESYHDVIIGTVTYRMSIIKNGITQAYDEAIRGPYLFLTDVTGTLEADTVIYVDVHAGDVVQVYTTFTAGGNPTIPWALGGGGDALDVTGTTETGVILNAPVAGQRVTEVIIGDGTTTSWTTNQPYVAGTLQVDATGAAVQPNVTNAALGTFTIPVLRLGERAILTYLVAEGPATGATNDPIADPDEVWRHIDPQQLGSGADLSGNNELTDNGTWQPRPTSRFLDWVFVTAHGAVGDGTTDDTVAIQAALDATPTGGVCYFPLPSVAYKITAALVIPHGMLIRGGGGFIGQYTKVLQATANTDAFTCPTATSAHVSFDGLQITGTIGGQTTGAAIDAVQSVNIRNCLTQGFYDGLRLTTDGTGSQAVYYSKVTDSFFDSATRAGIVLGGDVNNFTWRDCRVNANAYGLLAPGGPMSLRMFGGSVEGNTVGVSIDGLSATPQKTAGVLISGVYFEQDDGNIDIELGPTQPVYATTIQGCTFVKSSYTGTGWHIDADNGDTLIVTGNEFMSSDIIDAATITRTVFASNRDRNGGTITLHASAVIVDPAVSVTPSSVGGSNVAGTSHYWSRADHAHQGSAASFATPAIALGTSAAAGAAATVIRSDATIVAFDATVPVTQAFGDAAGTGSAAVAARRDHVHGMPAAPSSGGTIVMQSGTSSPPVPIWNSAGDDYVYSS